MKKAKKFGTFAGVFTPSVLTILGVIMYLRLGWVVGEAGLFSALAIIIISHIISISTGLSISSIATDKRIKTGGIYYILSRSLGLPMGGSIGLTLFFGTALSISLYIVGFVENFLSIAYIQDFLGMDGSVQDVRIVGTIVIIALVIIAFISTSLALKTQFIILAAIALSIVSIVIGFFVNTNFAPEMPILKPPSDGLALEKVFAVFFPAVTGFTAGVAMSGDLKDPKKSIPVGTIAAIATGLVVYIGLAIAIAYAVDREYLLNDYNFLSKVAYVGPLVLAGIWGATLSSALGGILGAPRIMQAIAVDKIMPKIFGKGYGASNEPRNALIFTFLIAEGGILLGELNVIASVVSMFYLASYGFINIAYSLESWASSDFRPSFSIPKWIGITGFIACFAVMFKLDMVSMIIALIIMSGIYFYLTRKQLKLEYGDVWQSVWISVIRNVLHRIDKKDIEERNWQPNIILFSGGVKKRPYLVEFGKFLVGRFGMLSNFELHQNKTSKVLFPKHKQSLPERNTSHKAIFTRQHTCKDIYDGIETIAATYGFSGVEPNTVLMGWARQSKAPVKFINMVGTLLKLDLNILLLDYDKRYGFGKFKRIDIWWRGAGNNGNLALTLAKFILTAPQWREAVIRLLIVSWDSSENETIINNAKRIFDNLRMSADVRIINNEIEQKPFYDIIRVESVDTDLIFLGIPPAIETGREKEFIERTSKLMKDIGTVVLIKASSQFKKINFAAGIELTKVKNDKTEVLNELVNETSETKDISYPQNAKIAAALQELYGKLNDQNRQFFQSVILQIGQETDEITSTIKGLIEKSFIQINEKIKHNNNKFELLKVIADVQSNFVLRARKLTTEQPKRQLENQKQYIEQAIIDVDKEITEIIDNLKETITETYTLKDLEIKQDDKRKLRWFKRINRMKVQLQGQPVQYHKKFRKTTENHLPYKQYDLIYTILEKWGVISYRYVLELIKSVKNVRNSMLILQNKVESFQSENEILANEEAKLLKQITEIEKLRQSIQQKHFSFINSSTKEIIGELSNDLKILNINNLIRKKRPKKLAKKQKNIRLLLQEVPQKWFSNQNLIYNSLHIEMLLLQFDNQLQKLFTDVAKQIEKKVENQLLRNLIRLNKYISIFIENFKPDKKQEFKPEYYTPHYSKEEYFASIKETIDEAQKVLQKHINLFPELLDMMTENSISEFRKHQFKGLKYTKTPVIRMIDYIVQENLITPIQKIIDQLPLRLFNANTNAYDIIRLITYSLDSEQHTQKNSQMDTENSLSFVKQQHKKLLDEIEITEQLRDQIVLLIQKRIYSTVEKLNIQSIVAIASKQEHKETETIKNPRLKRILQSYKKLGNQMQKQIGALIYKQNRAMLMKNSIGNNANPKTLVERIITFVEQISLNNSVLQKLPFFYQQLFLRENNHYNELWIGRQTEIVDFKKALDRYINGYHGGVFITGEINSGKTFFIHHVISKFLSKQTVFSIKPPLQGSCNREMLKHAITEATGMQGEHKMTFNALPEKSIVVFDDLELWWQKSENGNGVIEQIMKIIDEFSNRLIFIVAANIHSFEMMNKINELTAHFIQIIELKPMNAKRLESIIISRHKSSGLKFSIQQAKNKSALSEDDFRPVDYAALFSRIFSISYGNIGSALLVWMAAIIEFNRGNVVIRLPKTINFNAFSEISAIHRIILLQFVLHKHLTQKKLSEIMGTEIETITSQLAYLQRTGLIKEKQKNVYEINRFMYIHLIAKLKQENML